MESELITKLTKNYFTFHFDSQISEVMNLNSWPSIITCSLLKYLAYIQEP